MKARAVLASVLCILTACTLLAQKPPDPTVIPQNTPETTPQNLEITPTFAPTLSPVPVAGAMGPSNFSANVDPLTGVTVDDPSVLDRRPMVVKISNAPPLVRPQAGIGEADLVYEHYAEGGLTRFSAIFYSHAPKRVGSIRSARLIDYELVPMYQGLLAYSGASNGVQDKIAHSEFADRAYMGVLYGQPYYWRDESIAVPHNLFMNVAAVWDLAKQKGFAQRPNLQGMTFDADPASDSTALVGAANKIDVRFRATRVIWEYDAQNGVYRRFSDGKPHFDANLNQQVTADNVVVLYVGHYLTDIIESEFQGSVSYSIQITIWPRGNMSLFRDGQQYDGLWLRPTRPDLLSLQTKDGQWLYLKPGNTWFEVVQLPEQMNPQEEWVRVND